MLQGSYQLNERGFKALIYVDTSVIVAALDLTDPGRKKARKTLEANGSKVVSELVIAELASVLLDRTRC